MRGTYQISVQNLDKFASKSAYKGKSYRCDPNQGLQKLDSSQRLYAEIKLTLRQSLNT